MKELICALLAAGLLSSCTDPADNRNRHLCDEKAPKFGTAVYTQKKVRPGAGESDFVTTNPDTPGIFLRFYATLYKDTNTALDVEIVQRRATALCYEVFGISP